MTTPTSRTSSEVVYIGNSGKMESGGSRQRNTGSPDGDRKEVKILFFDLTYYNTTTQFLLCCAGVFVLYLLYGYMQELIFTLDGFKPYGWFLTLVQFAYYTGFGYIERSLESTKVPRCIPMKTYVLLAFLTLGTMGLSNSSLGYLNYPTQVIFKCCKLVPVLIGSILIQGKKHGPLDFFAAIAMCVGLTLFTLADSQVSPSFNPFGVLLISLALLCDAAIGNVQEKAMREHKAPNNEVVIYSYGIGFVYLSVIMLLTGNLFDGFAFCLKQVWFARKNLELVHSNICGPIEVSSQGGCRYYLTFIDDKSRRIAVYFLRQKSADEVYEAFENFRCKAVRQTGRKLKILRTDNGKEFTNHKLQVLVKRLGICHEMTVDYTPEQNGLAERRNRTIVERARCMLF